MAGKILTCEIESLAHGVAGVARTDGGVVFVPGTAPGDVVRARVVEEKRGWREAELVEVLSPSADRREPPCPHVVECGGCPWQHVSRPAQLEAKRAAVLDALVRIGGFADPEVLPILSFAEWGYRHRVNLRVDGEQRLGFYRHRSHRLVEIDACAIADPVVNRHLDTARRWLRGVSTEIRRVEIASTTGDRVVFVGNAEGPFRHDEPYHERFLAAEKAVAGIVLFGKGWRRSFGRPRIESEVDGMVLATEGGFTQVSREGNRGLVEAALTAAEPRADDRVLDLYCGAGNLTLPLARRVRQVIGVESEAASVQDARRNAERAGLSNCRFLAQPAGAAVRALAAEGEHFSLVVLDPPRSGAAEAVAGIAELAAGRIVYVSCNPATLARDAAALAARGFRLGAVRPIDLFPQTYHVEAVARLDRG